MAETTKNDLVSWSNRLVSYEFHLYLILHEIIGQVREILVDMKYIVKEYATHVKFHTGSEI
jgi:hypothetical protein